MKKVKLSIAEGSPGRTLLLFPSSEAAYVWASEAHDNPEVVEELDAEEVVVLPGESVEAEWRGCEYSYEGDTNLRVDFVRFAKLSKPQNASGFLVSIHFGWTHDAVIPFRQYKDNDIIVTNMTPDDEQLDLAVLFKDDEDKK